MRLIDADDLLHIYQNICIGIACKDCPMLTEYNRCKVEEIINEAPTIETDVDKVRHGIWIHREEAIIGNPFGHYECSICGNVMPHVITQYCCYCGAKMDVGGEK